MRREKRAKRKLTTARWIFLVLLNWFHQWLRELNFWLITNSRGACNKVGKKDNLVLSTELTM